MMRAAALTAAIVLGAIGTARANLIMDPGFETASQGSYTGGAALGDGWVADPAAYVNSGSNAHAGRNYIVLDSSGGSRIDGGVKQTVATTANTTYSLSFWVNTNSDTGTFSVTFGGTPVAGIPTSLPNTGLGATAYRQYTALVTAAGDTSVLAFDVTGTTGGTGRFTRLDDVSLEVAPTATAVPEPGSLALLGLGVVGAIARCRRRLA